MNTENKEEKKLPFEIKDFGLRSHINMGNAGIRIDAGTIVWPGNPINGKTICRQVYTKKTKAAGWGKGEVTFFLNEDKSPEFDTPEAFAAHYIVKEEPQEDNRHAPADLPRVRVKPEALAKRKEELKNKKK